MLTGLLVVMLPYGQGSCPGKVNKADTGSYCMLSGLPSTMTEAVLCSGATNDFPCCRVSTADIAPVSACKAGFEDEDTMVKCGEGIYKHEAADSVWWSMRCLPPPADSNDLDGATVGTIIVASVVGVTLIGGAIAVYQSSS